MPRSRPTACRIVAFSSPGFLFLPSSSILPLPRFLQRRNNVRPSTNSKNDIRGQWSSPLPLSRPGRARARNNPNKAARTRRRSPRSISKLRVRLVHNALLPVVEALSVVDVGEVFFFPSFFASSRMFRKSREISGEERNVERETWKKRMNGWKIRDRIYT